MSQNTIDAIEPTKYQDQTVDAREANRLLILAGSKFQEYDLDQFGKDRLYFGRDATKCDIVLPISTVSNVHGKIKIQNGRVYAADLNSTNGTYLYDENQFRKMVPNQYYEKDSGDWILKMDARGQSDQKAVVLVFTNSEKKGAW